jgi:large subunit ribosomal protein L2
LCFVSIGSIKIIKYNLNKYKKAGINYLYGKKPNVRGVAKNPVDHPHGGGEGKKSGKSISMSP